MKVLFVCPFVPWPLENGGKIRTYNLLASAGRQVEIDLLTIGDGAPRAESEAALRKVVHGVEWFERESPGLAKRVLRPKLERWFHSPALERRLGAASLADYDLVHLDELLLTRSLPASHAGPVLLHHHKLDRVLYERLTRDAGAKRHVDLWKLARLEREAARRFPDQLFCSREDAASFTADHPSVHGRALPSGFDPARFAPAPFEAREPARLLFLGSMDYGPNVDGALWLAREVVPRVLAKIPELRVDLVGANPPPIVRALADECIEVTGRVDDVRPYLARAGAMLVPLAIGGGTRLKIVEALAMNTPTISTTIGAEGLGLQPNEHLALADDAAGFARAIIALIQDRERARRLAETGGAFVRERYPWKRLGHELVEVWREVAAR